MATAECLNFTSILEMTARIQVRGMRAGWIAEVFEKNMKFAGGTLDCGSSSYRLPPVIDTETLPEWEAERR
jgi:hypothetical protein